MKKSLQQIEDYYIRKGLSGSKLRKALEADKGYREIVAKRKVRLTKKFKITQEEKKEYVLSIDQDYEILGKIKRLEKQKLSVGDKKLIKFIRTQLKDDWRTPRVKLLNIILKKYK
jgi:hypothetical protein